MLICIVHIQGHEMNNAMLTMSSVVLGKLGRRILFELCMVDLYEEDCVTGTAITEY